MAWTSSWEGFALEASDWRKVIMMISHLKLHWLLYWCVTHAFAALCVVSVVFPESYFFFFGRVVQYGSVFISLICWGGSPLYISQIRPLTSIKIDTWRIHSHEGVSNHYTVFAFFLNYLFQFPKWIFSGFDEICNTKKNVLNGVYTDTMQRCWIQRFKNNLN